MKDKTLRWASWAAFAVLLAAFVAVLVARTNGAITEAASGWIGALLIVAAIATGIARSVALRRRHADQASARSRG